jgi:hypothetical protein
MGGGLTVIMEEGCMASVGGGKAINLAWKNPNKIA